MISLTECIWEFQNNALWDTHQHDLFITGNLNNPHTSSYASYKVGYIR